MIVTFLSFSSPFFWTSSVAVPRACIQLVSLLFCRTGKYFKPIFELFFSLIIRNFWYWRSQCNTARTLRSCWRTYINIKIADCIELSQTRCAGLNMALTTWSSFVLPLLLPTEPWESGEGKRYSDSPPWMSA